MNPNRPWLALYPDSVRKEIPVSDISLTHVLEQTANTFPNHPAISYDGETWTYSELKAQVDAFASALQMQGVVKGDPIALMLPNCPQFVVAYYGILAAGGIVVQVNTMLVGRELQYILQDSRASTIIALDSFSPIIQEIRTHTNIGHVILVNLQSPPEVDQQGQSYEAFMQKSAGRPQPVRINPAEDVAVIQYTGGTTGRSKGAMLTHRNLVANIEQSDEMYKSVLTYGAERVLIVIPMFHSYGMTICMNLGIYQGSCLILMQRFELEEVLSTIKREKPTRFAGVPTMYIAMNNHPKAEEYGLHTIKLCHCGGAPLPTEIIHEFERKTGAVICEAYGLSEASPGLISHSPSIKRRIGSVGVALPSTDFKIVDAAMGTKELKPGETGELVIKGPQIMKGYWNNPEETSVSLRDGWLYTGDIVKMDDEGYVFIVDRKKDMIIASGYNIYPREVEEVLYEHPAVLEAVVVGAKDSYRGETVKAVIVLKEGIPAAPEDIIAYCKKNLAAYKVPKMVEIRTELPKTSVGKILRNALRDLA